MRGAVILVCVLAAAAVCAPAAVAGGGAPDRPVSLRDRVESLQEEVESLTEDIEDLREPVEEFDLFDQCMFTIGVTQYGKRSEDFGYVYGRGGRERRPALAMDMRGFDPPQYDFMAFPGEEPPQIECNEDAGGQDTDE